MNLRDSSVTVLLIGSQTWQRRHVDWEIYSLLRDTNANPRPGLVRILLPTHPKFNSPNYNRHIITKTLRQSAMVLQNSITGI